MMKSNAETNSLAGNVILESPQRQEVWPVLVNAYYEEGFSAGYARGINETLAAVLEATEEFASLRPGSSDETRRLLHSFSKFLEKNVRRAPRDDWAEFSDGSGI
jgi:hypothetical protein